MPVYPTHQHQFAPTGPETEQCGDCGYHRFRGVVGSEVPDDYEDPADG